VSTIHDKPTEAERAAERTRVMAPIINSDHLVFSIKLSVDWQNLPLEAHSLLHEKCITFANDMQLFLDRATEAKGGFWRNP
jgi:hypothetical protein